MSSLALLGLFVMTVLFSVVFRYALDWQGKKEDYLWFTALWFLLLGLWWGLDDQPVQDQAEFPEVIANTLALKCEQQASACILRARLDFAAQNYESALQYISRAQVLGGEETEQDLVTQMYLVASMYAYGLTVEIEPQIQSYLMVGDEEGRVRLVYANRLKQMNRLADAGMQYTSLCSILSKDHEQYVLVGKEALQLSLQTTGARGMDPL